MLLNPPISGRLLIPAILAILFPPILLPFPFNPAISVPVGVNPHGVIAGDFNGDGKIDLASSNASSNNVSILLGNGNGTFLPKVDYAVQQRPKFAEIGDFNNDGEIDLAVPNEVSNSVTVLLGVGNGTFLAGTHSPAGCTSPHEIAVGDLNNDGKLDVVIPCWGGNIIGVLFGNGNGSFQPPVTYTTGSAPHSAVIADFNKDGRNDIGVANYQSNNLTVQLSTGAGTFASPVPYSTAALPHFIRAADLNNDGNLDLFTANDGANNVSVFLGAGNGTFGSAVNYATASLPESVTSGDVNGDGILDLVTANSGSNNVSVLLGSGTGSFSSPTNFGAGSRAFHAIVAHLDSDNNLDIAVANYGGQEISILISLQTTPLPPGTFYLSSRTWTSMTNGWGPAERNSSNGENAAGDGTTIRLNGTGYANGLGVHAASELRYSVTGCSTFTSDIGVDDEVGSLGSVVFQVWGDTAKLFDSGVMTGTSVTQRVNVSIAGQSELRLVVTDSGDGANYDHADWADAKIVCSTDSTPPTVTTVNPTANATNVPSTTFVTAKFSELMNASTITTATFILTRQGSATPVAAVVAYSAATTTATLTPSSPLATGSAYNAVVKSGPSGVKDASGIPLASDFSWSFTTGTQTPAYLSDRTWLSATSGWGPVELDKSNGESAAGDGRTLTLAGVTYNKGLGVHSDSEIRYNIAGCSAFTAKVGIDDEVGSFGSVVFQVWGDSVKLFDSGIMTGTSQTQTATVNLAGRSELRLVVTNGGDNPDYDHADWADAQLTCGPDAVAPTVLSAAPSNNTTNASVLSAVTITFSESMSTPSINTSTFLLTKQGSTTPVSAAIVYNSSSNSATLIPIAALDISTTYTAVVKGGTAGVKDVAGNSLATDFGVNFTTNAQNSTYLSDRTWVTATSGWGPVELDKSNGEMSAGDGQPITLNGETHNKGLGVHAASEISYSVTGCSGFSAEIGVDDEVGNLGSVIFEVWGDSVKLFESSVMTGASSTQSIRVPLSGRSVLRLVITNAGDNSNYDHADWANARITCN